MPTKRTRRSRQRYESLTPAELEWLTGENQEGANVFVLLALKYPCYRDRQRRVIELVERNRALIPDRRWREIEPTVTECRRRLAASGDGGAANG